MTPRCLNCETELTGNFCHQCGQKASTQRITFSRFVSHDLMHGLFHLDKGVLYTMRALILKPGYAVKSFISGKRVQHYNIFALFIIMVACKALLDNYYDTDFAFESSNKNAGDDEANKLIQNYYKVIYLMCIPVLSLITWLLLRRLKYHYTEHIVLNCFLLTGAFFYSLILTLIGILLGNLLFNLLAFAAVVLYVMLGYYQATKDSYSFWGYLWRTIMVIFLFIVALFGGLIVMIMMFYDGGFTGKIGWH
jgi:hypothetical protein